MGNESKSKVDPIWDAAWSWVVRQHDRESFDTTVQTELARWLQVAPSHRDAYEKASRLWLLAGLVPPVNDLGEEAPADCD